MGFPLWATGSGSTLIGVIRKWVEVGVGTGTPGSARGGGPGGQGSGPDPDGGGSGAGSPGATSLGPIAPETGAGVVSTRVTKYSLTTGSNDIDVSELGAVGVPCWLQEAIRPARESTASGTSEREDLRNIWLSCKPDAFKLVGSATLKAQDVGQERRPQNSLIF